MLQVDGDSEEVGGECGEEQDDGVDPEDVGDDAEPAKVVVELVQVEGNDAGSLGNEEPLRAEVAEGL